MVEDKKTCNICIQELEIAFFRRRKYKENYFYDNICKNCQYKKRLKYILSEEYRVKQRALYQINKENLSKKRKLEYIPHPRKLKDKFFIKKRKAESSKRYYHNNKEKINKKRRSLILSDENKLKRKINNNLYYLSNKEKNSKQKNIYQNKKRKKDKSYALRKDISATIYILLKSQGGSKKNRSILNYLPSTIEEMKNHLEKQFDPWMNWDNRGKYNLKTWDDNDQTTWKWQIDHIIPQSDLPYSSMEDENFKKCWSLENIRPLSAKQNIIDGVTRIRHIKVKEEK